MEQKKVPLKNVGGMVKRLTLARVRAMKVVANLMNRKKFGLKISTIMSYVLHYTVKEKPNLLIIQI